MTTDVHAVLCASCRVEPKAAPELGEDMWRCPRCEQSDTKEAVYDDAKAFAVQWAQDKLSQALKATAAKSKMMTYKPGRRSTRTFRWVTEM